MSLTEIRSRIAKACDSAGRVPGDVTLIAVSKMQPDDRVRAVLEEGQRVFGENRVQEMSEISRAVKGMARELKVPVLACSQLSRAVEGRADHRPMLSDLRDSGSIEQDADIVMFIHREDLYYTEELWEQQFPNRDYPKNLAEIIVAKHRHGPTGSVKMRFRDNLVRFDALEVEDY